MTISTAQVQERLAKLIDPVASTYNVSALARASTMCQGKCSRAWKLTTRAASP